MKDFWSPYAALDYRIWLLAIARAINVMGFSLVMPFMAMYLVEQRGVLGTTYGLIFFLSGLMASFSQAEAGDKADRVGRSRVIVEALVLRSINMVGLGLAVVFGAHLFVLASLIILNGILRARVEPAVSAAVTDLTTPDNRVAAFGLQRIGINVGWAAGPALGGAFARESYGLMFFASVPLLLLAAWGMSRVGETIKPVARTAKDKLDWHVASDLWRNNRRFAWYLVLVLLSSMLTTQLFATMSVFARTHLHLDEGSIGLLYTVNGLLVVVLQIPAVAVIRRYGLPSVLVLGPAIHVLSYLAFGVARGFGDMALAISIVTFGEVLFAPAQNDMAAMLGDKERLGRAFGMFGFMQSLGVSIGPLLGGVVFDVFRESPFALWGTLAALMACITVGFFVFWRTQLKGSALTL